MANHKHRKRQKGVRRNNQRARPNHNQHAYHAEHGKQTFLTYSSKTVGHAWQCANGEGIVNKLVGQVGNAAACTTLNMWSWVREKVLPQHANYYKVHLMLKNRPHCWKAGYCSEDEGIISFDDRTFRKCIPKIPKMIWIGPERETVRRISIQYQVTPQYSGWYLVLWLDTPLLWEEFWTRTRNVFGTPTTQHTTLYSVQPPVIRYLSPGHGFVGFGHPYDGCWEMLLRGWYHGTLHALPWEVIKHKIQPFLPTAVWHLGPYTMEYAEYG
eukprot:TRINITY_DN41016_c0_g1_i1.p2 TRINITY_DN41016_c0_g1~~TRINITY_DN41016_c0_g1_i1.p2  ORF type:complete len:269 (+),score=17.51 TRINITY_DN41016_c0_g1_i1:82-888(+)